MGSVDLQARRFGGGDFLAEGSEDLVGVGHLVGGVRYMTIEGREIALEFLVVLTDSPK